jgi:hypothetical protein
METETSSVITLKGSTEIVTEFFEYSINSILYQRGIYPPETFKRVPKYGLAMMLTTDEALSAYISNIMHQLNGLWCFPLALTDPRLAYDGWSSKARIDCERKRIERDP